MKPRTAAIPYGSGMLHHRDDEVPRYLLLDLGHPVTATIYLAHQFTYPLGPTVE